VYIYIHIYIYTQEHRGDEMDDALKQLRMHKDLVTPTLIQINKDKSLRLQNDVNGIHIYIYILMDIYVYI
jgi:hypothetical protein